MVILLLLVIIRVLFLGSGLPTIIPEIKWLTLGEKLAEGGIMYRDVWDNTAPFAAFIYKWLFILFGNSTTPYQIISIILVLFQAVIFNNMFLKNKAFNKNTYVPALMYVLFMNLSFDFFTLPPILMAMTFILLAINNLFKNIKNQSKDEIFVEIGLYLGIATLFFLPSVCYFLVTVFSLLIYTNFIFRKMILLVYGYSIIILLACAYYYWHDALGVFNFQFIGSISKLKTIDYMTFSQLLIFAAIPIFIFVVSFFTINQNGRFINFQVKIQYIMLFFFLSGFLAMTMVKDFTTYQLMYFIPTVAFFVAHHVLIIRNWFVSEVTFLFFFISILANNFFFIKDYFHINKFANYDKLIVQKSANEEIIENKKILVIGEDIFEYFNAKLATPYLNWQYAKYHLANPNYYDNITAVYRNFMKDMPEVIIDKKGVIPDLFEKMPTIQSKYISKDEMIYILKP